MEFYVRDMMCKNCVKHVREALEELGFKNIIIDLDTKKVTCEGTASLDSAFKALSDAGYEPTNE